MLTPDEILDAVNAPFSFVRRPVPIPGDLRASWKVLLLLAMLARCCRGSRSSLHRLHVLNWATRVPRNGSILLGALAGVVDPTTVLVRLDPSLNRAIDRARGFGVVALPRGNRVVLMAAGVRVASQLESSDVFSTELETLGEIGHRLSEGKTTEILQWYDR